MFDSRICERWDPPDTPGSRSLIDALCGEARAENQAAARRLKRIGELFEMRRRERGEEEHWAVDTWAAVGAEIAVALRISLGKAGSYIEYARAMRQLPSVATVFMAGGIDMQTFQTIVYRTELVTDDAVRAIVDEQLAAWVARCPSMSRGQLTREIDRIVNAHDPDAVRRAKERARSRDITIWDNKDGTSDVSGRLWSTDAQLLDKRLDELAATVCDGDPRNLENRRADALGALAAGAGRLMCRCGQSQCPAVVPTRSGVVIHVVAEQATLRGDSDRPGYLIGADSLITAEALRDLAVIATLRPLNQTPDAPAEPGYRPSRALADFVRARDLTCRAPGCSRPATECDLDHTVPYADGGATHRSNIKTLCRFHHLMKTFWGWRDRQLPDGAVIWDLPDGQTYVTTPGSALLFPALMAPTGTSPARPVGERADAGGERTAMMPSRRTTRASNRAHRIITERIHNHQVRTGTRPRGNPPPEADDPPF